jgi:hypothetical protein
MRTFKMGATDALLKDMTLGLYTTADNAQLKVSIFEVGNTTPFPPLASPPAPTATQTFTTFATQTGTNNGAWFTPTSFNSSIANYMFKAGKNYGIVFAGTTTAPGQVGLATCLTAGVSCASAAPSWVATGGIVIPIAAGGATLAVSTNSGSSWAAATAAQQSAFMEFNFTPVPAPALMGFSSLSGLMVYSRRLRSRIKGAVA